MNGDQARLTFLLETVALEAAHPNLTDERLFSRPFDADHAQALSTNTNEAERVDAFVARFGRLQDTLGDKSLPTLLIALAEPLGPPIDHLDRAEKLRLLPSAEELIAARKLRNRMVHEYVRDAAELACALNAGHRFVPLLRSFAERIPEACRARHWPTPKR